MKNSYFYTICFMLVLSLILATALALANAYFQPIIQRNQDQAEKKAVLDALALDFSGSADEVEARFSQFVQLSDNRDFRLFIRLDSMGQVVGYAVPFNGPGLWGSIQGYLGVSADRRKTLGIVFTAQNETPGLGGRIDETSFRDQFRGLDISSGKILAYGAADSQIDAIAGATATSNAVLLIVNRLISQVLPDLEVLP